MFKRKFSNKDWLYAAIILAVLLIAFNIVLMRYLKKAGNEPTIKGAGRLKATPPASLFSPPVLPEMPAEPAHKPLIAIVIDDLGYDETPAKELAQINPAITISILPYLRHSQSTAQNAHARGQEILLHIPMEPQSHEKLYPLQPGMLLVKMPQLQIRREIQQQIEQVPHITGANNHMGSLFTGSRDVLLPVLEEIRKQGLFFLDSETGPHSVAYKTALDLGIPALRRDVFLDDPPGKEFTLNQMRLAVKIARKKGFAIAIGHPHEGTIKALEEFVPLLDEQGVDLVKVSKLLDY